MRATYRKAQLYFSDPTGKHSYHPDSYHFTSSGELNRFDQIDIDRGYDLVDALEEAEEQARKNRAGLVLPFPLCLAPLLGMHKKLYGLLDGISAFGRP